MVALALFLAVHSQGTALPQTPTDGFVIKKPVIRTIRYLVSVPDDYKEANKPFPLILFLHGSGERGWDLNDVRRHGPPKEIAAGRKFPFIIVSPQCDPGKSWEPDVLNALLSEIEHHYKIDRSREYLTGLSMGGGGTWSLAIADPGRFAAIAPIAGFGDPSQIAILKDTPVWATHGDSDPTVPIAREQVLVDALKAAGGDVKFDIIPGGMHDVWTPVYASQSLYDWFLSHQLKKK